MSGGDITVGVPPKILVAVEAYATSRQAPTMFLRALIGNQLDDCCAYLPPGMTLAELRASVRFIFNRVEGRARGSYGNIDAWISFKTPSREVEERGS